MDILPLTSELIVLCQDNYDFYLDRVSNFLKYDFIGFDIELTKKIPSIIQFSNNTTIVIIQLRYFDALPLEIKNILESNDIYKVGVGIHGDKNYLKKLGIKVNGIIDLRFLQHKLEVFETLVKGYSLKCLCEHYLGYTLDKDTKIHTIAACEWDSKVLSNTHINYAARDSLAGYLIFKEMLKKFKFKLEFSLCCLKKECSDIFIEGARYSKMNLTKGKKKEFIKVGCIEDPEKFYFLSEKSIEKFKTKGLIVITDDGPKTLKKVGIPEFISKGDMVKKCIITGSEDKLVKCRILPNWIINKIGREYFYKKQREDFFVQSLENEKWNRIFLNVLHNFAQSKSIIFFTKVERATIKSLIKIDSKEGIKKYFAKKNLKDISTKEQATNILMEYKERDIISLLLKKLFRKDFIELAYTIRQKFVETMNPDLSMMLGWTPDCKIE